MASKVKTKKRTLPAWMTAAHDQSKQLKKLKDDDSACKNLAQGASANATSDAGSNSKGKNDNAEECTAAKSVSDLITDAMPFLKVPRSVIYTYQAADCSCTCNEILSFLDDKGKVPVGFDMEWPVTYNRGSSDKTALIQMCFSGEECYLFQVCGMNPIPKQLIKLICHEHILLVGLNIESDLWKLERDFDIRVKILMDRGSVIDVGKLANKKLKSSERWDLNGLCKNVLGLQLNKDSSIRCGSWNDIPLSKDQIAYSSADAYAGILLYEKLTDAS